MSDEELRRLADLHRVATSYVDVRDRTVPVSPETLRSVLAALGVDAASARAIRTALRDVEQRTRGAGLPAVSVVRRGHRIPVPRGTELEVVSQRGLWRIPPDGRLPGELRPGWYPVRAASAASQGPGTERHGQPVVPHGSRDDEAAHWLALTPDRLSRPRRMADRRLAGLMVQLYATASRASWGLGDLADLAELARWSGGAGAGFILVNPLHATRPVPPVGASPYRPVCRRYASPLYLRIEQVPEFGRLPAADRAHLDRLGVEVRGGRQQVGPEPDLIDRDAVWTAKREALERLFAVPMSDSRRAAYHRYRHREGQALTDFATWCAFAEAHGSRWRDWPAGLRHPRSPQVSAEAARLRDRVDFHVWLQWLLDEQLVAAQRSAISAGMPLGVVHDLAVGVDPDGADTWTHQEVYAEGVTVGVPPDAFNPLGQNWQQPPWHPGRLADAGYAPYRDMVRAWLRHGGGLRVDHVMGLFRLWWVPAGADPTEGTYVHYDHEAMVGILALEAELADAVVVGEDLGTVEPWVRGYLVERGVLGTSLLWFESAPDGSPRPPSQWRPDCLATVDTHDMPPVAGYVSGDYVEVRQRLGNLGQPVAQARAELEAKVDAWRELLASLGLLSDPQAPLPELVAALHAALATSPSVLVGLSLTDLVGERRSQNIPGTDQEYPNWRVPLADGSGRPVLADDLVRRDDVTAQLADVVRALD